MTLLSTFFHRQHCKEHKVLRRPVVLLLFLNSAFQLTQSFLILHTRTLLPGPGTTAPLVRLRQASNSNYNDGDNDNDEETFAALAHNVARTDVRNFLTQRSLQSFVFLLQQCRDPHTVKWLEDTYELNNMDQFHGTGFLNLTVWGEWDTLLRDMIGQPDDVVVVSAKRRGRGQGGWSRENPYLEERFMEFKIDIEPASLVSRIMSVREQIANEWVKDLDTILVTNEAILTSYHDNHMRSRDDEEDDDDDDDDREEQNVAGELSDGSSHASTPRAPEQLGRRRAFERDSMVFLRNAIGFSARSSSPYRQSSFDLLCLLATQESVHRVLREYHSDDTRQVSYAWLRKFYMERVDSHFDGSGRYGRADDFLEEVLLASPSTKETEAGELELIDPLRVAEDVILERSVVATDWKKEMVNVGQDHVGLRKELLARQMGASVTPSPFTEVDTEEPTGSFE